MGGGLSLAILNKNKTYGDMVEEGFHTVATFYDMLDSFDCKTIFLNFPLKLLQIFVFEFNFNCRTRQAKLGGIPTS